MSTSRIHTSTWEDWALPVVFVLAVGGAALFHQAIPFPTIAGEADAGLPRQPDYIMTITAKRLPAECKGRSGLAMPTYCASYLSGDAIVEMREGGDRSGR